MTPTQKRAFGIVKLLIGVGIVAWLLWSNRDALDAVNGDNFRPGLFAYAFALIVVAVVLSFVRWWMLVRAAGLVLGLRDALLMGFVAYAFNLLMPGAVGGDLVKSVMIARRQSRRVTAVTTIFMDRVIGLTGIVLTTTVVGGAWLIFGDPQSLLRSIALATLLFFPALVLGYFVLFNRRILEASFFQRMAEHPRIGSLVTGVLDAVRAYRARPQAIVYGIGLTLIAQSILILGIWMLGLALYPNPAPLETHFLLMPLGLSAGAVPLTPGGLGVLDFAIVELYRIAGEAPAAAVAMMLGYRLTQVVLSVFGFLLYFLFARRLVDHSTSASTPE